jgi:hypothetical protein
MQFFLSQSKDKEKQIRRENSKNVIAMDGWLMKLKRGKGGVIIPSWNRRWFSLEGRYLKWYKSVADTIPRSFVDLQLVTRVTPFETEGGTYSFIISHPDRNLMLRADNMDEMNQWLRAIRVQVDLLRGGNGTSSMNVVMEKRDSNDSPQSKNNRKRSIEVELDKALSALTNLEVEEKTSTTTKTITTSMNSPHRHSAQIL